MSTEFGDALLESYRFKPRRRRRVLLRPGFRPASGVCLAGRLSWWNVFAAQDIKRPYNVMKGHLGRHEVVAFDYRATDPETQRIRDISALAVLGTVPLPCLLIRPEGAIDKIASLAGWQDIDFESQEFSKKFTVRCADRRLAYNLIHPQMMEHLLAHPSWTVASGGSELVVYTGALWRIREFRMAADFLAGFLDLVPEFVWKDLASRKEAG